MAKKTDTKAATTTDSKSDNTDGFSEQERAAMKERAAELREQKKTGRGTAKRKKDLAAVLEKIAEMPKDDQEIATRLHELVTQVAPELDAKTWYGMPAWAKDGTLILFFQSGAKFDTRYCTVGFTDKAALDDGDLWPSAYAVTRFTPKVEKALEALIRTAVG